MINAIATESWGWLFLTLSLFVSYVFLIDIMVSQSKLRDVPQLLIRLLASWKDFSDTGFHIFIILFVRHLYHFFACGGGGQFTGIDPISL